MKTIIQFFAMFIAISGLAHAGDGGKNPTAYGVKIISEQHSRIYQLYFNKKPSDAVKVRIHNAADQTIFKETINESDAFIRSYNLRRLPEDNYFIEVIDGDYLYRRALSEESDLHDNFIRKVSVNAIDSAKKKYKVAVMNNTGGLISIKIFDRNGLLIYAAEEEIELHFGKIYDLSRIDSSEFTFEISDRFGIIKSIKFQEYPNKRITLAAAFKD